MPVTAHMISDSMGPAHLSPPFSKESADGCAPFSSCVLPHGFRDPDGRILDPRKHLAAYLSANLRTPRVSRLHSLLWLAGLPRPARPLHRQRLLQRAICPSENPNEHMVWHETCIFLKPLPPFLLDHGFWDRHLCHDRALYASACGLLLSYTWLVMHRSDLGVAIESGLLPPGLTWEAWTSLATSILDRVDVNTLRDVDCRYGYGELRLSRLNTLYRLGFAGLSRQNAVFGFMSQSIRYNTFFERNFSWIVVAFVYITVALSALQVALSTEKLSADTHFQEFSYGAAIVSLVFVLVSVTIVGAVWLTLFWYHLLSTWQYCKKVELSRRSAAVA